MLSYEDSLLFIPTYNEVGNIGLLVEQIREIFPQLNILIIDDNSSDGTREAILSLEERFLGVDHIFRDGEFGIGDAHKAAIEFAYQEAIPYLITMDADFSHRPQDLTRILAAVNSSDVVIGSRYLQPGSLSEWDAFRRAISSGAHFLTKILLGHQYDSTSGFRAYALSRIDKRAFDLVEAKNYEFFVKSITSLFANKYKITEVPIVTPIRRRGKTKMKIRHIVISLASIFILSFDLRILRKYYL